MLRTYLVKPRHHVGVKLRLFVQYVHDAMADEAFLFCVLYLDFHIFCFVCAKLRKAIHVCMSALLDLKLLEESTKKYVRRVVLRRS